MLLYLVAFQIEDTRSAITIVWQTLNGMLVGLLERLPFIVVGLVVFITFIFVGRMLRRLVFSTSTRTRLDDTLARLLGRIVSAAAVVLGLLLAAVVIIPTFRPGDLVAGLGITSVAIGFAFKDVLQNFFAGILLLWRRPFVLGDEIKVDEYEGVVEEVTVRATRIRTFDGEKAIIPNGDIYTSRFIVFTAYPARRLRLTVGIGYTDDIEKARGVILDTVKRTEGVYDEPAPGVYLQELGPSSVNFSVRYWIDPRSSALTIGDRVATGIKYALDKAGIDMPYPHSVVLFHDVTGTRDGDIDRREYLAAPNRSSRATRA